MIAIHRQASGLVHLQATESIAAVNNLVVGQKNATSWWVLQHLKDEGKDRNRRKIEGEISPRVASLLCGKQKLKGVEWRQRRWKRTHMHPPMMIIRLSFCSRMGAFGGLLESFHYLRDPQLQSSKERGARKDDGGNTDDPGARPILEWRRLSYWIQVKKGCGVNV